VKWLFRREGQAAGMKKKKSLTIPMQGFLIKLTTYKAEN
jgi:hypothetical protein